MTHDYKNINREAWNKRTKVHVDSDFYNQEAFMNGETSLRQIELGLLGDISGKSVLHLQCHFGQDTISLARMGASSTGVDLSDEAVKKAKELAAELNVDANFVCCDVYDAVNHIDQKFDVVFTSYGTIGWLPDLDQWAQVVTHFLKPGGQFVFVEFHPFVWMFDPQMKQIDYRYFTSDPIVEVSSGTYADRDSDIEYKEISWNHGLAEVVQALLDHGLVIQSFKEYDFAPYQCFDNLYEAEPQKFRFKKWDDKVPMTYSIVATKNSIARS